MTDSDNSPSYMDAVVYEDSSGNTGTNPAWDEVFAVVPEEYHQALTPHFQKWDQGVNQKFQSLHEEYKPYKNYKEQGYDTQKIDFALGVAKMLDEDPMQIYSALSGYLSEQGLLEAMDQEEDEDYAEEESNYDPRYAELQEGYATLAEAWLQEQALKQEAEEDAALEYELNQMEGKYGEFDEEYVLAKMAAGMDTEDAVKSWFSAKDAILRERNRPNPPRILGSTGSYSGQPQIDPTKLQGKSRRDLVADILNSQR